MAKRTPPSEGKKKKAKRAGKKALKKIKKSKSELVGQIGPPKSFSDEALIEALTKTLGNYSVAARLLHCDRTAINKRVKGNKILEDLVADLREAHIDLAENQLLSRIQMGDTTAIIFFLKCRAKDRGYIDKIALEHSGNITGQSVLVVPGMIQNEDWLKQVQDYYSQKTNLDEEPKKE